MSHKTSDFIATMTQYIQTETKDLNDDLNVSINQVYNVMMNVMMKMNRTMEFVNTTNELLTNINKKSTTNDELLNAEHEAIFTLFSAKQTR